MKDLEPSDHLEDEKHLAVDENRVVVFGTNMNGSTDFSNQFLMYLKDNGLPNPRVVRERNVHLINETFFDSSSGRQTLPRGVVIFLEMRRYDQTGAGETIFTPVEEIENLCEGHGVPYVFMESFDPRTGLQTLDFLKLPPPKEN